MSVVKWPLLIQRVKCIASRLHFLSVYLPVWSIMIFMKAGYYGRNGRKGWTQDCHCLCLPALTSVTISQSCQWQFVPDVIKCETASHIFLSVCDIDFCLISIKWRFVTVKVSVSCGCSQFWYYLFNETSNPEHLKKSTRHLSSSMFIINSQSQMKKSVWIYILLCSENVWRSSPWNVTRSISRQEPENMPECQLVVALWHILSWIWGMQPVSILARADNSVDPAL